jgi:aromatic-L-amino-acid decarboxylase
MSPLDVAPNEFRALAGRVGEVAAEFLATLDESLTLSPTSAASTAASFDVPLSEEGLGAAALDDLTEISKHLRAPTGRRLPYVVGSGEPIAALGDFYASVLNQNVTAWRSAPAAVTIERTVVRWLAEAIGCAGFTGSLTSGGSSANLMGLAMAREANAPANEDGVQGGVVYASDEVHMSVPKAVAVLGLGRANLRLIPVDSEFRMDVGALDAAVSKDRRSGKRGVAIVASAGTITTGAIDPLAEIASVAREHDLWLHVDGAYGALAALASPEKFVGLGLADSLSVDAHKWLYQPLDCSLLLFRDAAQARRTFAYTGDYAKTLTDDPVEGFAFFEESLELTRRFRALKIWLSLRYHGAGAFREAIRGNLRQAQLLREAVAAEPMFELLAPVELSAVCFRWNDGSDGATVDSRNAQILARLTQRGVVYLSNATVRGVAGLRACIVNHRTSDRDIRIVMDEVREAVKETT